MLVLWRERRCEVRNYLNSDCITMSFLMDSAGEARADWADGMVTCSQRLLLLYHC